MRTIEIHGNDGRNRRLTLIPDSLPFLNQGALVLHCAEHVIRMQRLERCIGADDSDVRLRKIGNDLKPVTCGRRGIDPVQIDPLTATEWKQVLLVFQQNK